MSRKSSTRYGANLKAYFDRKAFQNSGRAERHAQYLSDKAARKAARATQ